ncbi:phosphate/phosphite/phosphonate ABC transporter substrate-binding protein [Pseudodesulfovibrio sp.]|uniref:phosphate/phosphite/phosphonate ABC transporter substrate-binding protein n=1 Tax=Pseudodesulfovibrio sp. TaxID=2035812 RepID=UPI0026302A39|nr:phosphate/phosphite/phosphonate ABC transporter substrate-binding protein [Pseudodesulfovibrio sp.]MDD3313026.1 phosphate/phosphite/phosphonate ABC transporter substrate-binding protein [Pseudodesulfovibrio sp.]
MRPFLRIVLLLLSLATLLPSGSAAAAEKGLVMGLVYTETPEILLKSWTPLFEDMSRYLGAPVKGAVAEDYAGIIWYLATGKAQLAWVGNKAAIEAVDRADSEVLAQSVTLTGPGYYSHLIVPRASPLRDVEDVLRSAGTLSFGNGDPNSTSGYVVPGYYIFAARGLEPGKLFKRVTHGSHEENFHDVASGKTDVATSNSSALARYEQRFPDEFERIRIIWTSPMIPSDPIVVHKDLDPALKAKIRAFLLQYGKPGKGKSEEQAAREVQRLAARKWTGFRPSDDAQLIPIRKLELYKERLGIERNATLPESTRQERIRAIEAKIERLGPYPPAP